MNISISEDKNVIRVSGSLEIYAAESFQHLLREHLSSREELILDLGTVEACDATAIQLLCSVQKTAARDGKSIRFEAVSPAIAECCAQLGLTAQRFESHPIEQR